MNAKSALPPAPALDLPQLDMSVAETLSRWPALTAVFVRRQMACPGCAMSEFMSLADAADAYQADADGLLFDLRAALGPKS